MRRVSHVYDSERGDNPGRVVCEYLNIGCQFASSCVMCVKDLPMLFYHDAYIMNRSCMLFCRMWGPHGVLTPWLGPVLPGGLTRN